MGFQLHIGVDDKLYQVGPGRKSVRTKQVQQILEKKYHIMQFFYEHNQQMIADEIAANIEKNFGRIQATHKSKRLGNLVFNERIIKKEFQKFLERGAMDGRVPGVPTKAALKGINHRLQRPYAKTNPRRPSFIDTGTFMKAFRAWTENIK